MEGVCWWTSTIDNSGHGADGGWVYNAMCIPQTYWEGYVPYTFELVSTYRDIGASNANADGTKKDTEYNSGGTAVYMRQARKFTQYYIDNNDSEWVTYPNGEAKQTTP